MTVSFLFSFTGWRLVNTRTNTLLPLLIKVSHAHPMSGIGKLCGTMIAILFILLAVKLILLTTDRLHGGFVRNNAEKPFLFGDP